MSLFGDLKRVFFGAKSVAKHQAEKAGDAAKEKFEEVSDELAERGEHLKAIAKDKLDETAEKARETLHDLTEKGSEALGHLGEKVYKEADVLADKGQELRDKGSDWINERLGSLNTSADNTAADLEDARAQGLTEDPSPRSPKAGDIDFEAGLTDDPGFSAMPKEPSAAREVADRTLDAAARTGLDAKAAAERLGEKVMDVSEEIGGKVLEKGSELLDKAAGLGADLKGKADDFVEKASAEAEKMKMEEAIEKAKAAAEQAEARARAYGNKESEKDTDDSLLDGTDSFFDRAARYADGDYHREGKVRIVDNDDPDQNKVSLTKKGKVDLTGFDDRDGDGDPLIDDAQLEEE